MITERDRTIISETIRRFVARDIERRGIAETYEPEALTVSAADLLEFAASLVLDADGDHVSLAAEAVQDERDGATPLPLPILGRLDRWT